MTDKATECLRLSLLGKEIDIYRNSIPHYINQHISIAFRIDSSCQSNIGYDIATKQFKTGLSSFIIFEAVSLAYYYILNYNIAKKRSVFSFAKSKVRKFECNYINAGLIYFNIRGLNHSSTFKFDSNRSCISFRRSKREHIIMFYLAISIRIDINYIDSCSVIFLIANNCCFS